MLHTKNQLPRLHRTKFSYKNIEVVFHNSFSWVKIRLHTKNQLPGLPGSALKVCVVGWWWWVPLNYVVTSTLFWVRVGL
jgi:hypothetical protein